MKLIDKKNCKFINGYIIDSEDNVVYPGHKIVDQLHKIEDILQRAEFVKDQPEVSNGPDFSQFKHQSAFDNSINLTVETPLLDQQVEDTLKIMNELDQVEAVNKCQDILDSIPELISFVSSDYICSTEESPIQIDTLTIGNPLELTATKLTELILSIADGVIK